MSPQSSTYNILRLVSPRSVFALRLVRIPLTFFVFKLVLYSIYSFFLINYSYKSIYLSIFLCLPNYYPFSLFIFLVIDQFLVVLISLSNFHHPYYYHYYFAKLLYLNQTIISIKLYIHQILNSSKIYIYQIIIGSKFITNKLFSPFYTKLYQNKNFQYLYFKKKRSPRQQGKTSLDFFPFFKFYNFV